MSDLLHNTLNRNAHYAAMTGQPLPPRHTSPTMGSNASDASDDENALTPVHTRPGTPTGTPRRRGSRTPAESRSTSPSRLAKKRMAEEAERRRSRDPLVRFDNTISARIFRELDVLDLARAQRVCKKWSRSATINWAFFIRFHERRSESALSTEPVWTRRDAKENWAARYKSAFTMNGLQYQTAFEMEYEKARSDGYLTPKEQREEKWAAENAASASSQSGESGNLHTVFGGDKLAAREFYKSLGGRSKVKSKTHASGPRDRTGFSEEYDEY